MMLSRSARTSTATALAASRGLLVGVGAPSWKNCRRLDSFLGVTMRAKELEGYNELINILTEIEEESKPQLR